MQQVFANLSAVIAKSQKHPNARKWLAGSVAGAFLLYQAYPVLYAWELIPFVTTDAWRAKEAGIGYGNLEGIVFDTYETGLKPPRSEMLPTSRGAMIIK